MSIDKKVKKYTLQWTDYNQNDLMWKWKHWEGKPASFSNYLQFWIEIEKLIKEEESLIECLVSSNEYIREYKKYIKKEKAI